MRASVWVDDRNEIFRRGLVSCLDADGFALAGESATFIPEPDLRRVDVLVFDLDRVAIGRAVQIAGGAPTRLVGITAAPRDETLLEAVDAGLAGLLLRSEVTPSGLVNCVRAVMCGNSAVPRHLLPTLLRSRDGAGRPGGVWRLQRRELDVLHLLAEGATTREIAEDLCYSEKTVKNVVHDLLVKMSCRTRAHAVALAVRRGLI